MKRLLAASLALVLFGAVVFAVSRPGDTAEAKVRAPKNFWGIVPQTSVTPKDAEYMRAGGIESIRIPLVWAAIQPTRKGGYNWAEVDAAMGNAARAGLHIFVTLGTPPRWVAAKPTSLPVANATQRAAWTAFLKAAVKRYGPGGEYWAERRVKGPGPVYEEAVPKPSPVREWQIWNESNFFYFAYPVSPQVYGSLVTISSKAIKSVSPSAKIILAGLFARPKAKGKRGMAATTYLDQLYNYPGIRSRFDGIDLHPYAIDYEEFEAMIEEFQGVALENNDRPGFYITEMGWGSQNNFREVAFEQGPQGQAKQLRKSYEYLLANQRKLNLKQAYWFSWKDLDDSCNFCDSVGFFHDGEGFKPKPAWRAFVRLTGGKVRP